MAASKQNFTVTPDPAAGNLLITVHAQQDPLVMARDWPRGVVAQFPGPWNQVVIDLGETQNTTSSFIAGLMIFHRTWSKGPGRMIILANPSAMLQRSLQTLNIIGMFQVR